MLGPDPMLHKQYRPYQPVLMQTLCDLKILTIVEAPMSNNFKIKKNLTHTWFNSTSKALNRLAIVGKSGGLHNYFQKLKLDKNKKGSELGGFTLHISCRQKFVENEIFL